MKENTVLNGYDVSKYQTPDVVADGKFVLAKCGEGLDWQDPKYVVHQATARDRGQLFGGYWEVWPTFDPVECARNAVRLAGLRPGEVFAVSFEPLVVRDRLPKWDPSAWPAWLVLFVTELERLTGQPPLLYLNDWHADQIAQYATPDQLAAIRRCPLWKAGRNNNYVASPDQEPGDLHGWDALTCWQWTDSNQKLDRDVFYGDADDWRALGGIPKEEKPLIGSNGWPILTSYTGAQFVACGEGRPHDVVDEDAAKIFAWLCYRLDTEIFASHGGCVSACGARTWAEQMRINPAVRDSDHLTGTACDFADARYHPYEPRLRRTRYYSGFTRAEEKRIRAICADFGILQWGGDFPSPWRDPVHYQYKEDLVRFKQHIRVVSDADAHKAAVKVDRLVKRIQKTVGAKADGYAGPGTEAAVRAWQRRNGLAADGIFGRKSQRKAGWHKKPPKFPLRRGNAYAVDDHTKYTHSGVRRGDRKWIKKIQHKVGVHADGVFGPRTEAAVKDWQRKHHLAADGEVGDSTWKAMF